MTRHAHSALLAVVVISLCARPASAQDGGLSQDDDGSSSDSAVGRDADGPLDAGPDAGPAQDAGTADAAEDAGPTSSPGQDAFAIQRQIFEARQDRDAVAYMLKQKKKEAEEAKTQLDAAKKAYDDACKGQPPAPVPPAAEARSAQCVAEDKSRQESEAKFQKLAAEVLLLQADLDQKQKRVDELVEPYLRDEATYYKLTERLDRALKVRCMTAICWGGNGRKFGVEPLIDLPVGIVWSVGRGSLSSYINSTNLSVEFNAGLRLWVANDLFSISVYFAKPVARQGDNIRLRGSPVIHSVDQIHRPYPSVGFGFFGDVLILGIAYDVLVNASNDRQDLAYPPNEVLSRSLTFTLGISTFTTARNAIAIGATSASGGK